jgi:hypothetical protein
MTRVTSITWVAVDILILVIALVAVFFKLQQQGNAGKGVLNRFRSLFMPIRRLFQCDLLRAGDNLHSKVYLLTGPKQSFNYIFPILFLLSAYQRPALEPTVASSPASAQINQKAVETCGG